MVKALPSSSPRSYLTIAAKSIIIDWWHINHGLWSTTYKQAVEALRMSGGDPDAAASMLFFG